MKYSNWFIFSCIIYVISKTVLPPYFYQYTQKNFMSPPRRRSFVPGVVLEREQV